MARVPRGLVGGLAASLILAWGPYLLAPSTGMAAAWVQTGVFGALSMLTVVSRRAKVGVVRTAQRYVINPLVRALFAVGLNPLGLVILETRGRRSGQPRRTPVGNGRTGDVLWIIAEHGERANYVRNVRADPRVRVRIRCGLRYRWVDGLATVLPDDDAVARQRRIVRWHPLRAFNAINVRMLGTDLLTVRVVLLGEPAAGGGPLAHSVMPDPGSSAPVPSAEGQDLRAPGRHDDRRGVVAHS